MEEELNSPGDNFITINEVEGLERRGTSNQKPNLLNYWYPVCFVEDFDGRRPKPIQLFGEPLVIFRGKENQVVCLQDRCAHRSTPLSIGSVKDGAIECRYHGWQFTDGGKCIRIPSMIDKEIPQSIKVPSYPATEREDLIWIWIGDPDKASLATGFPEPAPEYKSKKWKGTSQTIDQNCTYWCLIENLLDPGHLQFTHEGTQGKYIGGTNENFPDLHVLNISETLADGGFQCVVNTTSTKKNLTFKLIFDPPITVRLEVTLPYGWRFHQVHYCVPITETKSRLLLHSYRNWLKFIPDSYFLKSNLRIIGQDQSILYAQQLRLCQGSSSWNYPVKADALGIRYRKWREDIETRSKPWFKGYAGSSFKKNGVKRGIAGIGVGGGGENDIEALPNCCGACDSNLSQLNEIQQNSPGLWPSEKKFGEGIFNSQSVSSILNILFYIGYFFVIGVAVLYLVNEYG